MRIFTVTCNGQAVAIVRAESPAAAVQIGRELAEPFGLHGNLAAREPDDGEMVSWLENRSDHLLPAAAPMAEAS